MSNTFNDLITARRSQYALSNASTISDNEIEAIINLAVKDVPSSFNSQSARVVLLLGEHHHKLWDIVKSTLQAQITAEAFAATKAKIDGCFDSGYGTILFFEDQKVVKGLQESFPLYAPQFQIWSTTASGMHQYAIWLLLTQSGLGASLQHYNPIIDEAVQKQWGLDSSWQLMAQMPFGVALTEAPVKEFQPLSDRIKIFR